MNAPLPPAHMAQAELEYLPVASIRPSGTPIQALRRARFSAEGILELAASIKEAGVIEPIIVRPITPDGHIKYELVAGERRWLATDRAGLAHVPAIVRNLTAAQVLTTQLIENKQRDDYTPLEEGQGYKDLMDLDNLNAEQVGAMIGKSRAYVYARRKLCDLGPEARQALQENRIDASHALLLARIPGEKLQSKGLALISETNWRGEPISYKEAVAKLRDGCMRSLAGVTFALEDATLYREEKGERRGERRRIELPACTVCPSCSRNDPELHRDLAGADVCTDTPCLDAKLACVTLKREAAAEAAGATVISGDAAKKIAPRKDKLVGYVDLDEPCPEDEFPETEPPYSANEDDDAIEDESPEHRAWEERLEAWRGRTYRQLLGPEHQLPVTLIKDPKTKAVRELVPFDAANKLLARQHEIKLPKHLGAPEPVHGPAPRVDWEAERKAREEREEKELVWRRRLLKEIAAKCSGPIKREEIVDLIDTVVEHDEYAVKGGLKEIYPKLPEPGQLKDGELGKFVRLALVAECTCRAHAGPQPLLALAKRFKVDVNKVKAAIAAEEKAKAKGAKAKPEEKGSKK